MQTNDLIDRSRILELAQLAVCVPSLLQWLEGVAREMSGGQSALE